MKKLLAVTGCPTGIAHTFMAAEALKKAAEAAGAQIKVETNKNNSVCKNANKLLTEIEKILPRQRYVQLDLFEF